MKTNKETFAGLLETSAYYRDTRTVFDDLLTLALCAFSQNPNTGKSYREDEYMATIGRYPKEDVQTLFPKLLACLITEMDERAGSDSGNDVLGEYYETHLYNKRSSQYFTPWPICKFMAKSIGIDAVEKDTRKRILDPTCGSGRMLLAGAETYGKRHEFYGIDIDAVCVKMAAINLFLNGMFHSEVMCANALSPDDFRFSYKISLLPFGVFRIDNKEQSPLWRMYTSSFKEKQEEKREIVLPSENGEEPIESGPQLELF